LRRTMVPDGRQLWVFQRHVTCFSMPGRPPEHSKPRRHDGHYLCLPVCKHVHVGKPWACAAWCHRLHLARSRRRAVRLRVLKCPSCRSVRPPHKHPHAPVRMLLMRSLCRADCGRKRQMGNPRLFLVGLVGTGGGMHGVCLSQHFGFCHQVCRNVSVHARGYARSALAPRAPY